MKIKVLYTKIKMRIIHKMCFLFISSLRSFIYTHFKRKMWKWNIIFLLRSKHFFWHTWAVREGVVFAVRGRSFKSPTSSTHYIFKGHHYALIFSLSPQQQFFLYLKVVHFGWPEVNPSLSVHIPTWVPNDGLAFGIQVSQVLTAKS